MKSSSRSIFVLPLVMLMLCSPAAFSGWFADNLIDPEDGMLDASDYLASAHGFLPVPIIITEPAVGFGLGAAIAYFHPPKEIDRDKHPHTGPPSISVGFGAKTENGTYLYGGGHFGVWKSDHIRYLGALAKMNVNLTFYPEGPLGSIVGTNGLDFNINGNVLFQKMQFRIKESDWWLGGSYVYLNADNTFDFRPDLPDELPRPNLDFTLGGLSLFLQYDGRNSIFTPSDGLAGTIEYRNFDKNWGSDFDYDYYSGTLYHYTPIGDYSSLGLRLSGETVHGDVPFFAYPFVMLRGIPALRYQGKAVLLGEAEYLWGLTPRWSLVFFGGVGYTTAVNDKLGENRTVGAGGVGFRYRLARKQRLQAGIDIARGPEDTAIYLIVGNAWQF